MAGKKKSPTDGQLSMLDSASNPRKSSEWGTFKDSLRAPIHNWFTYPAGFSHVAVSHFLEVSRARPSKSVVFDPFMGSGTTNLVAKLLGIDSVGIEAHPFVFEITQSKLMWDLNFAEIDKFLARIQGAIPVASDREIVSSNRARFPELLQKCFLPGTLYQLGWFRDQVSRSRLSSESKRFLRTALICSLRDVSIAATGWPYIAPKKVKVTSLSKDPLPTLMKRLARMRADVEWALYETAGKKSIHECILGDSRQTNIPDSSATHIFTSPPYLNNFDYADRTRLEMYFMGEAETWGEISAKVRTKLMTSATTQINRADMRYELSSELGKSCPKEFDFLSDAVDRLGTLRLTKGGKKSYDLMVAGYFNDMFQILAESARILKSGGASAFVLGDSAPYGVHIPTDELIGRIGVQVGFSSYHIEQLRTRGDKWSANPQRHNTPLRESIVHLQK